MLDRIFGFEYTLWIVAFAFYAADVGVVARANEMLFAESWKRLRPVLARVPFSFRGGDLYWIAPFAPFAAVFRAGLATGTAPADPGAPGIDAMRELLWPWRLTSTLIFLLLFVAGPWLTHARGLGWAALTVLPMAYLISLTGVVLLALQAKRLGLARKAVWSLGFDCFACIPYAANMTKRLALRLDGSGRADDWMKLGAWPEEVEQVQSILAERKAQS